MKKTNLPKKCDDEAIWKVKERVVRKSVREISPSFYKKVNELIPFSIINEIEVGETGNIILTPEARKIVKNAVEEASNSCSLSNSERNFLLDHAVKNAAKFIENYLFDNEHLIEWLIPGYSLEQKKVFLCNVCNQCGLVGDQREVTKQEFPSDEFGIKILPPRNLVYVKMVVCENCDTESKGVRGDQE